MRRASLTVAAALSLGLASLAAACSESFPALPQPTVDASLTPGGPLEAQPPPIVPEASRVNASSSSVAFDAVRGGVWTANGDVGTISYVDPSARKVVQEIAIGQDTRSIALSPDGVWIAAVDRGEGTVTLVDAASRTVVRAIALGIHPRACVWDAADPRWLYVTEEEDGSVVVVDRTLGAIADTIPVGRRPAGLAVSASARELYVAHRIDAEVTILDLHDRSVAADVPLADEPASSPTVPSGKPLGFESLAVTADGAHVWAPHELLAGTHPIVFNETLFPAISVVDVTNRVEQQTDPNSPVGDIAGRKNLFDAIRIPGPNGQLAVFSQPCAVAMHPSGFVAWALLCGSEDLLAFNVGHGNATQALRGLPCDHPSGMTLDDKGVRIFVLCDQSKQLLTLVTGGGDPTAHAALDGAPIDVAVDTLAKKDPTLRAGLQLFFQATSAKGALASTGNNWMSCAGCHLDGFGSTNLRLFETLVPPPNQAIDAQIGHVGLTDHFSTSVLSPGPTFDPHDILVALLDQGGLAPDRTGASRANAVDPRKPPAAAVQMAQALARVVARDLPSHPTWLQNAGPAPDATYLTYDGSWCGGCHPSEYEAWKGSVHAHSAADPMMLFGVSQEQALQPWCAGCHDPVRTRAGDTSLSHPRGVSCLGCHDVTRLVEGGGNADLVATTHDWTADHKEWGLASLELLKKPEFCGGCHRQFVPGSGLGAISTLDEYRQSPYSPSTRCVDCHMPRIGTTSVTNHLFPGGNVYMGQLIASEGSGPPAGDGGVDAGLLLDQQLANLQHVAQLSARTVAGGVLVTVRNGGAGHWFPTGVTDIREPWIELQTRDAKGQVLQDHIGGPTPATGNELPPGAARLGIDFAAEDGSLLTFHQLVRATSIPFDQRVPSGESLALFIPMPASALAGVASIEALLYYRNVRTSFYRGATGDAGAVPPQTVMARAIVQGFP